MQPVIKVQDLVQKIGKKIILNGVSFELFPGEYFGLFGTRGAGKTALLHVLAGIDRFRSGTVEILGYDIRKTEKFKKQLGLVTEVPSLFADLKTVENLDFIGTLKNTRRENIRQMVERFKLAEYLDEPAKALTAGVYQRLSLACALLNEPELLIVDDLFGDFDPDSRRIILQELDKYVAGGGACISGFSRIECCRYVNRVGWLENRQLEVYQPEEAQKRWERLLLGAPKSGESDV